MTDAALHCTATYSAVLHLVSIILRCSNAIMSQQHFDLRIDGEAIKTVR